MLSGGWKEFAFFDATPVRDPSPPDALLYSDPEMQQIVGSQFSTVFMMTRQGLIKEFSEDMQLQRAFSIYDAHEDRVPDFIYSVPNTLLLLTASSKLGGPVELKVWDLRLDEDLDPKESIDVPPKLHSQSLVHNKTNTFPPTAFVAAPDLSVVIVGYADGSVIAVRGDLMHDRGTKQRLIYTAPTSVTGVHLSPDFSQAFVASLTQVVSISTTTAKSLVVLDKSRGANRLCTAGTFGSDFVVARDADIVCYNPRHRGPSFELLFAKRQVYLHSSGDFLVIVGAFEPENRGMLTTESIRVIIVELVNHIVAFNQPLGNGGVKTIFEAWGRLNIVGQNGIMYVLREKSWKSQIDLLKQRNLYQVAIEMVRRRRERDRKLLETKKSRKSGGSDTAELESNASENETLEQMLHQDYADYLFAKNDIDASLKEYILAIDLGQTSRVIRRFKDSQHVSTLLAYLSALFDRGKSTPQHVTLQIICYTKIGGKQTELQHFLNKAVELMPDTFDFEQAIAVLTETHSRDYANLAAQLAAKYPDPDRVVQIKLRQLNDVKGALDYIQTVSVADALRILIQNSRFMLNKLPVETTAVLITLFTGKFTTRTGVDLDKTTTSPEAPTGSSVNDMPMLQSYQAFLNFLGSASYLGSSIVSAETLEQEVSTPSYLPPRPRLIFPSFIGHDNEFVIFLEACLKAAPHFSSSTKDLDDIASTLFEAYLRVGAKDRASALVDEHADLLYPINVLSVSNLFNFELTAEQQHLLGKPYLDIFRERLQSGDVSSALDVLFAHKNRELAAIAPKLISLNKSAMESISSEKFLEILDLAITTGEATHVELISELKHSPYLTVGDLRPFIQGFLSNSQAQTRRQEKLANSYIEEIDEKRRPSPDSGNGAIKPQNGVDRDISTDTEHERDNVMIINYGSCAQCQLPLDLPATHFECQHSYHETCLSEDSPQCPRCLPELENADNLARQAEEAAANEAYFFEELQKRDKQKVVWDFISRGALSKVL